MEYINNGDSASSIRTKLNLLIDFYNAATTTTTTTTYSPPPYNPPANDSFTIWHNGGAMPMPSMDSSSACSAIDMMSQTSVYLQKDPMNMAGTVVPEANDYVYSDSAKTMSLSSGFYGYKDTAMFTNKYIEVGMNGQILSVTNCV